MPFKRLYNGGQRGLSGEAQLGLRGTSAGFQGGPIGKAQQGLTDGVQKGRGDKVQRGLYHGGQDSGVDGVQRVVRRVAQRPG